MNSNELRKKFLEFFKENGHTVVSSSSLLPTDPSVLFTTAGMQQFKPYYLGEKSPFGKNVASCQKCIRTSDIEEVGDEKHLTFFEMLGNFSFGGYFKDEAIRLAYDFIVREMGLEIDYVTVFSPDKVAEGDWRKGVQEDKDSFEIWKKMGVLENKIKREGIDNFWGPTGDEGPCGPTTEIYVNGIEVWNIVFNEFFCGKDKKLKKLEPAGVDTGMGLERLAMISQKKPSIFETDLFENIIKEMEKLSKKKYEDHKKEFRIIADRVKSFCFLILDGVIPYKKGQGNVLSRLIKDSVEVGWGLGLKYDDINNLTFVVKDIYRDIYFQDDKKIEEKIIETAKPEEKKIEGIIITGLDSTARAMLKPDYDPYVWHSSSGVPESIIEQQWERGSKSKEAFEIVWERGKKKHQDLSRTASAGMFKGGLADASMETTRLHTAAHLMLAGLRKVLGDNVIQKGSNITPERLRFDFSHKEKMTPEQLKQVEDFVNEAISRKLPVRFEEMPLEEAKKMNATGVFESKYGERVKVYIIGEGENIVSKEICGGPHVNNTSELGNFKIIKEESSSGGVRRIKAILK